MEFRLLIIIAILLLTLTCCWVQESSSSPPPDTEKVIECPPWYFLSTEGNCVFNDKLTGIVDRRGNTSKLQIGFCMTLLLNTSSLVVAQCPYIPAGSINDSHYSTVYQILPEDVNLLNEAVCGPYNRRGLICSECKENYGLAAYRYYGLMCVKCTHTFWNSAAYVILLFATTTASFLTFLCFNINVHTGNLTGLIFFSHTIVATVSFFPSLIFPFELQFGYWPVQILLSLYGVWSLNSLQFLIPPFCVSPHLTTLHLISLGYVPSVYAFFLCIVLYYLIEAHDKGNKILVKAWKPFKRLFIKFKHPSSAHFSVIYTFGTVIILSYGKNLFITFTLLQGFSLVQFNSSTNTLKYPFPHSVDLQSPYLGQTHMPYFVLGIVGGVFTVLLPLVLVLLFPTRVFPKLIQCCGLRRWHGVRTFMEMFTGTFKDGTDERLGNTDCRWAAALLLFGRVLLGACSTYHKEINSKNARQTSWLLSAVPYILFSVGFAYIKPHRRPLHNIIDILLLLLIAKICICFYFIFNLDSYTDADTVKIISLLIMIDLTIPQLILITYFSYKVLSWLCVQDAKSLLCVLRAGKGERNNARALLINNQ